MKSLITISFLCLAQFSIAQNDEFMPTYKYDTKKVAIFDEIEIAYLDEGAQDAPVIVMVHGLGGYIKNWYPTIEGLSDEYRCIALDLPGYGQSTLRAFDEEDYMDFFARTLDTFVKKLELDNVILMGHSMGGQVSVVTALQNPNWLDQLILAAPAGFETFTNEEAATLKQFSSATVLMSHTEDQIRAAYKINFVNMPPLAEEMIQDRIKAKEAPWFNDYAKVREMGVKGMLSHPVFAELDQIKVPAYVLFGEKDFLIPNRYLHAGMTTQQVAEVGNKIPNVKIKMIEAAGHMLQMDNPAGFNRAVKQMLTN
ncbi:Pimeloyl-ACP methyl ester carboxylesterase [Ekhidna lutea]|uniref:Pimeloyl-ACP methyl ester carboxylesterase n=1 Tax=Ekhidna lutea TaxID=447679 RepID=A0A239FC71_EKHLU|nr:alpha/beta fold hydrolase [Ekhidna lutea]SNS54365.1 Pimeloyl-ACP methyl ester carboxylesterase [Ekhidna lutea]